MSNYIIIAVAGYFLLAVEAVFSKFLLTSRVKSWRLYSFYVGMLSLIAIIFAPFGLQWGGWIIFGCAILSGMIFFIGLIFLFKALKTSSATRVFVLFGAIVTIGTLVFANMLIGKLFTVNEIFGVIFLLLGGFMISFKFYKLRFFSNYKNAFFAGFLVSFALVLLKYVFDSQNFVSGYVFSRMGMFLMAMSLMLSPHFRKKLSASFRKGQRKKQGKNMSGIIAAKTIAGVGTLLVSYAISLGSVTLVNALVSVQYMFTFILATITGIYFSQHMHEKITLTNILFKSLGILSVVIGIFLVK